MVSRALRVVGWVLTRILYACWVALMIATPLFGFWLASSLASYDNATQWLSLGVGLLLFPILPLGWDALFVETRQIVTAICEADEDARASAGRSAAERVASDVNSKFEDLRRARDNAYHLIDDVIADDNLKDKRDEAKQLREDVSKRWDSITNMAERAMKGANHPLVSFLIREGQDAHNDKQRNCHASEFVLDSGKRVDCIMATGESCLVVELKPENSRAVSSGVDQARGYAKELNTELKRKDSSIIKKLIGINSDFEKCKEFTYRVDCYKLCPSVDENGEFREAHPDWKRDCT